MDLHGLDDIALLWRVAHGHDDALAELYERYGRLVFSVAYHALGDYAVAEEATQDVFLRVWTRADQYDPTRAQVRTWLVSIARHRAIDLLRRQGSRPEHSSIAWADLGPEDEPATGDDTTAALGDLHLAQRRVQAAVAELPESQREALALAYFGGYTQREIAERLGEPLGTVKTRIHLAMQKLRRALVDIG